MLQNLRSFALSLVQRSAAEGSEASSGDGSYVVLEVDVAQAELVTFMANYGKLQFLAAGPEDTEIATTTGINLERMVNEYAFPYPKTVRVPAAGAQ